MRYIYIYLDVKRDISVTNDMRKKYLLSLAGSFNKLGQIEKFNNAIGFGPVINKFEQEGRRIPPEIEVASGYEAPCDILQNGVHIVLGKHSLLKIEMPDKRVVCNADSRFSYSVSELSERFIQFLRKVYPDILISKIIRNTRIRAYLITSITDYFYRNLDFNSPFITVELSSHRLLTDKELDFLTKRIRSWVSYPFHIDQYYCETCAEYNKKTPYHIEIVYD